MEGGEENKEDANKSQIDRNSNALTPNQRFFHNDNEKILDRLLRSRTCFIGPTYTFLFKICPSKKVNSKLYPDLRAIFCHFSINL